MVINEYQVIVGNIGTVYNGTNLATAKKVYREYWNQSDAQYGRASNEDVTLMRNGEPIRTHYGNKPQGDSMATRIGTSHFVSFTAAVNYYIQQGIHAADVMAKVNAGEITIGAPQLIRPNESIEVDTDGRYIIVVIEPTKDELDKQQRIGELRANTQ
jgi:hypothetical protein